jgi:hypothetical protein
MFTNEEIDNIVKLLHEYSGDDVEYVYDLYDTSYENRPDFPKCIIISIQNKIDIKNLRNIFNDYYILEECCYGIGYVLVFSKTQK